MINPQISGLGVNIMSFKISVNGENGDSETLSHYGFIANGGYAFMDRLFGTAAIGFQGGKLGDYKLNAFILGVGARYYTPANIFIGGGFHLLTGKLDTGNDGMLDDDEDDNSQKMTLVNFQLQAGYPIYICKNVFFEPSIVWDTKIAGGKIDDGVKFKYNMFSLNLGFNILF